MAMPKMNQPDPTEYRVPRNFKLLDELENAEKGKYTDVQKWGDACNWANLGLDGQDATFTHWNATIIPQQGGHIGDRIYTLKIVAGPGYPEDPPEFRFVQQVAMNCVSKQGKVLFDKMKNFEWHRERCLFEALLAIRKEMEPAAVAQACARIGQNKTY
mmetsp:Transcript_33783/g.54055  ORF Transcript_33783/g.54055 Transcript_33783/m.54055 type:complete len:158 (-) Transcript_33783:106-579(-)|eukprot:CAMPEP_0197054700 /NCGR_PEP_ID=MMETSP1384-20130603/48028_1 /TAXON_ID=29189 /ORGANISM="Ammonia sp." /LENGTH=157 /DNA_ID=CAMNT_0042487971 /DNA_START=55 /DNA_END=528 /DNA_ORIENTATION=+